MRPMAIVLLLASCGDAVCAECRSPDACELGEICIPATATQPSSCARACSLVVYHEGPGYEVPCAAGVDGCPETCADENGVFGHCMLRPGLPDGVGVCVAPAGEFVCPVGEEAGPG